MDEQTVSPVASMGTAASARTDGSVAPARTAEPVQVPQPLDPVEAVGAESNYYSPQLGIADGFRFGCGLILAGLALSFLLIILLATVVLAAVLLSIPLPLGVPGGQ